MRRRSFSSYVPWFSRGAFQNLILIFFCSLFFIPVPFHILVCFSCCTRNCYSNMQNLFLRSPVWRSIKSKSSLRLRVSWGFDIVLINSSGSSPKGHQAGRPSLLYRVVGIHYLLVSFLFSILINLVPILPPILCAQCLSPFSSFHHWTSCLSFTRPLFLGFLGLWIGSHIFYSNWDLLLFRNRTLFF